VDTKAVENVRMYPVKCARWYPAAMGKRETANLILREWIEI
tara:strand:- start:501 stop:623 length:123 start_codon:yes stop_codon:yes gene_type:complete